MGAEAGVSAASGVDCDADAKGLPALCGLTWYAMTDALRDYLMLVRPVKYHTTTSYSIYSFVFDGAGLRGLGP